MYNDKTMRKIRKLTKRIYIKNKVCEKCGFKGYTEFHHITPTIFHIRELCTMCHSGSKISKKRWIIAFLVEELKKK